METKDIHPASYFLRTGLPLLFAAVLLIVVPVSVARYFLATARIAKLDPAPNYLSHLPPNTSTGKLSNRLLSILDKDMQSANAVPRVFLSSLPPNLGRLANVTQKKRLFVSTMLPLVLRANEFILADRARIIGLYQKYQSGATLRDSEMEWLAGLMKKFRIKTASRSMDEKVEALLHRVDVIPPSLALAQAAIESGWGTSRFAQAGNAIFGEWVWGDEEGILPQEREEGKTHRIKSFEYLLDSIASYMVNLNRHVSYAELRERRAELRSHNLPLTGPALAPALIHYSERGTEYVNDILSIINYNDFDGLDSARLIASAS